MTSLAAPEEGWPQLDDLALYGLAGEVVRTIEPHTEADPAALLFDFLTAFGCAVGRGPHFEADGAAHPARLFTLLIGNTSRARKGTSRARIERVFEAADPRWSRDRVAGGLASGEGLIRAVASDGDGPPADARLLVVEPEFARLLAAASREGSVLSHIVRQAFDGGDLRVMTRKEPLRARGAHISILAHITREELARRLDDVEIANGFANRFLFVLVRRSKLLPTGGTLADEDLAELARAVRRRLEDARRVGLMRRSPEGELYWASMYAGLAEDDPPGLLGAVIARAEAQLLRLSIIYALLDGTETIDHNHTLAAFAALKFTHECARRIFGDRTGDPIADKLLVSLRAAGPAGLDGEAQHALFSRHGGAALERARTLLVERRFARIDREKTGGRPREKLVAIHDPSHLSLSSQAGEGERWAQ